MISFANFRHFLDRIVTFKPQIALLESIEIIVSMKSHRALLFIELEVVRIAQRLPTDWRPFVELQEGHFSEV